MKNHTLVLLLLLFSGSVVCAQTPFKDYMVKNTGDTISAKIKYNIMGKGVYKLSKDSSSHPVDTTFVHEYYWSKQKPFDFVAVVLPDIGKKRFVGVLEKGMINLYVRTVRGSRSSTNYWYASKNGHVLEINNQKRLFGVNNKLKRNFEMLIGDNDRIVSEFERSKKYNIKVIRNTIRRYNATNI